MKIKSPVNIQVILFFALLIIITVLFGYILKPFFLAIFWAALLASIFSPLYQLLNKKFRRPNLGATITFISILIIFILPAGFIISLLINESLDIYQALNSGGSQWIEKIKTAINSVSHNPILARLNLDEDFLVAKSADVFKGITNYIFENLSALTQNTILFLVQFAVMLYTLFYFLRDGKNFIESISNHLPLDKRHSEMFINQFLTTARATLKFTLVIGGIQGILGGIVFYIAGVERALIWGLLMVAFSIVPAIGCAIIWAPAGIIMLFMGHIWQGIMILIFGLVVITTVDNLLRPILLGKDIQMHSLLIFLSTLGGIGLFGFSGFVLGPLITSFFLASWDLFLDLHQHEQEKG
jgi:predicted PurR-regulated permease PerM